MKKVLSKSIIFLLLLTILSCCNLTASAYIKCDGHLNRYEWDDYEEIILFDSSRPFSDCYHSGSLKYKYIEEDRRVYLGITLENAEKKDDGTEDVPSEVYLSFNDSSQIILRSDLTADFEETEFFLNFGHYKSYPIGESFEIETVLKELNFEETLTIKIQFRDSSGVTSQKYSVQIKSEELRESESASVAEKQTSKAERTTKKKSPKTTKEKETTTKLITEVISENFNDYSQTLKKSNNSVLIVSIVCVITSVSALIITLFRKK